jgi:hypothetical protein
MQFTGFTDKQSKHMTNVIHQCQHADDFKPFGPGEMPRVTQYKVQTGLTTGTAIKIYCHKENQNE